MKRRLPFLLFFAFVALLLIVCGILSSGKEEEMTILVYANLTEKGVDWREVNHFNAIHRKEGIQIEVRDYFEEDGWSGVDRLLTEMASGNVPDIIDLGSHPSALPYRQLVRKGYLEDLWPYINSDPDLNGQLWEAPLKAAEVDGGLYTVFSTVTVNTLIGDSRVVGSRYSWTLEELLDTLDSMPQGSTALEYYLTKSEMFDYVFRMSLDSYVDWETEELSFDSDKFRAALEFVNSFPDSVPSLEFEGGWEDAQLEVGDRVRHGEQMLSVQDIAQLFEVYALDWVYAHNSQVAFIGYPMEDGSAGSVFNIQGTKLAMSSTCKNKDAAWELIRRKLTRQFTNSISAVFFWGIPVNRLDFDAVKQAAVRPPHDRRYQGYTYYFFNYSIKVWLRRVQLGVVSRFNDFVNHIDKIDLYDTTIYDLVREQSGPYFAGDKALDETIRLIENRVGLYVNEQK